jgi:hypothetical protein
MSTVPVPEHGPPWNPLDLFGMASGTSVATAVVAGEAALRIEKRRCAGLPWTPGEIRRELLSRRLLLPVPGL